MKKSSSPNETTRSAAAHNRLLRMFRFGVVISAAMVVLSLFSHITTHLVNRLGKGQEQTATAGKIQDKTLQAYEKPHFKVFNNLFVSDAIASPPGVPPAC